MATPVLEVSSLSVVRGGNPVLRDVSLAVERGTCVGVFGALGSGKTTLLRAVCGALSPDADAQGSVRLQGTSMLGSSEAEWRDVRGTTIAALPQDVDTAFAPDQTIGSQLLDLMALHEKGKGPSARERALAIMESLGTRDPEDVFDALPATLPLGRLQQAAVAAALLCEPRCLVVENAAAHLDEPARVRMMTTLHQRCTTGGLATLLLDSNPAIVVQYSDRTHVLVGGEIVERGRTRDVFAAPTHPFTVEALRAYSTPLEGLGQRSTASTAALAPQGGCVYSPTCAARPRYAEQLGPDGERCVDARPEFHVVSDEHQHRCHLSARELRLDRQETP